MFPASVTNEWPSATEFPTATHHEARHPAAPGLCFQSRGRPGPCTTGTINVDRDRHFSVRPANHRLSQRSAHGRHQAASGPSSWTAYRR